MTNNSSTKQQELKQIALIVRALVESRKSPCYLKDILREYPEVESKPLPYKNLGYKTAQELLEDTGEFSFRGSHGSGDTIITVKPSNKTAHIASMVRGQKTSKTARIAPVKAMKQPPRMPANRSNGFGFGGGDRNNNNSNNFQSNNNRGGNNSHQQQQQQMQRQRSMDSSHNQQKDLREMLNSKKNQKLPPQQSNNEQTKSQQQNVNQSKQSGPRPILGASKPPNTKESQSPADTKKHNSKPQQTQQQSQTQNNSNNKQSVTPPAGRGQSMPAKDRTTQQRLNINQNNQEQAQPVVQTSEQQQQGPSVNPPFNKLASRLQHQQPPQQQQQTPPANIRQVVNHGDPMQHMRGLQNRLNMVNHSVDFSNQHKPSFNQFNSKIDAITALNQYCRSKNLPAPRFSCIKGKFSGKKFTCSVHVSDTIPPVSTYPNEYDNEYMAKDACAHLALEKIKMLEKKRPMPPCSFTNTELLDKLYTELLNHPHGIFEKNLPELFEKTFQQSLPDNWSDLINKSSLFTTETGLSKVIIFANKDADKDIIPLGAGDKKKIIQIDPICLPWSDDHWNIFITHCASTVEVWGRLFGADYSARCDALLNDIEVYMSSKKERPVSIARKNIYLIYVNDCWHRVRVEELDKSNGCALCFFIDFGDAEWRNVDQLYICETHFLRLPAQAVPFSLYGLEDFEGNPYAVDCLNKLLPNHASVVGKVFTKKSEFYDTNSKFHGKIQVVIFDTSTQEDVNLNHQLSNMICEETVAPEIKQTLENFTVTHVNDNGDIFIQACAIQYEPAINYFKNLLQQTVKSKLNRDQHKITFEDLKRSNMFLICDDDDANDVKWYRGSLADANVKPDADKYPMYFVDHGFNKSVDISKIFLLESLSLALSKFPAQAIKVRLYDIPDITKNTNIVGRIRGLLPNGCGALARLSKAGPVPLVTIYTRFDSLGSLCNINESIRVEHELEKCSDLKPSGISGGPDENKSSSKFSLDFAQHNSNSASLASPSTPTGNAFIDITRGLTLTTIPGSPKKASDLPKLNDYASIPAVGDYFEVRVTMSANPSNFTIQPFKDYPNLRALMKELQEFCQNSDEFIPTDMVEIGEAYAAKNPDGYFNRVTAVKKYGDMIHVSFCDFGDIATIDSSQLKTLPLKFRQLPKMAVQAKLHGIKPVNGDWTLDDCLYFRQLTVGKTFVSIIKNVTRDKNNPLPTQILEMELIDVSTDDDVYITKILLENKRAIQDN